MNINELNHKTLSFVSGCFNHRNGKISCTFAPSISTREVVLFFCLLLVGSMASLHAQGMFETNLQIRCNDPAITVTVTNASGYANPQAGDRLTIQLEGLPTNKKAIVKAGTSFGDQTPNRWDIQTTGNSFTFIMPDYKLFIDINVQYITTPDTYTLTVETKGLSAAKVAIAVTGNESTLITSPYQVKPGIQVTASLPASLPARVRLLGIEGSATDGSWFMNPVMAEGSSFPGQVTFNMPATDVILRFVFKEDAAPGPGPSPDPGPSPSPDPDDPDDPDTPDPGPVANEQITEAGVHLRTSEGVLYIDAAGQATAHIYTFSGVLVRTVGLAGGEQAVTLSRRPYIVRIAGQSFKISL